MSDPGGVSRRDFLRRASKEAAKEAVDIGTRVVPAAGLVRDFLQSEPATTAAEDDGVAVPEEAPPPIAAPAVKNPLSFLAAWRAKRHNRDNDTH